MTRSRSVLAALLVAMVSAACSGGGEDALQIGIKRVALNLAFEEEELAEPVAPETIIRIIPAPPAVEVPGDLDDFRTPETPPPTIPPLFPVCDEAPAGAAPVDVVTFGIDRPPAAGVYSRHATGTVEVKGGAFPLTLPYPPIVSWEISEPEAVAVPPPLGVGPAVTAPEYEVTKVLTPTIRTIDRYRLLADRVQLIKRTTVNGLETTEFEPSPAIDFYVFGAEGDTWTSAATDLERGTAMLFQATIVDREVVDVCGEAFDTYRVEVTETVVNLATGETSGTERDDPIVYNVATHLGGLIVREDVHTTLTTTDPETSAPLVLEFDYVSTLDDVEPDPPETTDG